MWQLSSYLHPSHHCRPWWWGALVRWSQGFCCALIYSIQPSMTGSKEIPRITTTYAFISIHSTFKSGVVSSFTFPIGLCRAYRMTLGRSGSRLLSRSSPLDPFPLLIDQAEGPQLSLRSFHFTCSFI